MTGMYLNPINASTQTFLCKGTSAPEHLLVYWVGPLLATAIASWLGINVQAIIKSPLIRSPSQMLKLQWNFAVTESEKKVQ